MPQREILRCFFGTLDKAGTIEKGKRADLVLLDANPLENISNPERRSGVDAQRKIYGQTEMNKWLDEIAPRIAGSHIEKSNPQKEAAETFKRRTEKEKEMVK